MGLRSRRGRGTSLIEVTVAMAIIGLMMVGVLQMFTLSLVQNQGSAARTQMTYKAQQIVDTIRLSQYLGKQASPATMAVNAGVAYPLVAAGFKALPYVSGDANYSFWGPPPGLNVIERANDTYRMFYKVEQAVATPDIMNVTVVAIPADSPDLASFGGTSASTDGRYVGKISKLKRVEYVAQIPAP